MILFAENVKLCFFVEARGIRNVLSCVDGGCRELSYLHGLHRNRAELQCADCLGVQADMSRLTTQTDKMTCASSEDSD